MADGGVIKRVHTFPEGISSKGNVMAQLLLEHAYHDVAVQYVNHNALRTPLPLINM